MSWILLFVAICLEVCGTTCMKLAHGFARLIPSVLVFIFYGASFGAFTIVLKHIHVSVAYAIWSGTGTVLITMIGWYWFAEPLGSVKLISIGLIILGVVGLNLSRM